MFEKDVEDAIIDIWSLPQPNGKKDEQLTDTNENSGDPLDKLISDYPGLVTVQNDKQEEDVRVDIQQQEEMFDFEDNEEEFLNDNEKTFENGDDE